MENGFLKAFTPSPHIRPFTHRRRCPAQGHLHPWLGGESNQQPPGFQTTALRLLSQLYHVNTGHVMQMTCTFPPCCGWWVLKHRCVHTGRRLNPECHHQAKPIAALGEAAWGPTNQSQDSVDVYLTAPRLFGRMIQEQHPNRPATSSSFALVAGNGTHFEKKGAALSLKRGGELKRQA